MKPQPLPPKEIQRRLGISRANSGQKRSPETCEKIRQQALGRRHREATKIKISESLKGSFFDQERKDAISQGNARYWAGKTVSPERRQKISEAMKGRRLTPEHRANISKGMRAKAQERRQ